MQVSADVSTSLRCHGTLIWAVKDTDAWQIRVHVGTGISTQQGKISMSETKRNHMGQGLGNTGGEAKQLFFSFFKNAVTIAEE